MYDMSCLNIPYQANNLVELAECLCRTVEEECGLALCWCGLYPGGLPAWDYCGACNTGRCGMGYVSVTEGYLSAGLGVPQPSTECASYTTLVVRVGVLRCMPTGGDQGEPPEPNELADTAMVLFADMMAMKKAILCCYPGDTLLRAYEALPASGGCVGGQWTVEIELE